MNSDLSRRSFTRAAAATLFASGAALGRAAEDRDRAAAGPDARTLITGAQSNALREAVLSVFDIARIAQPMVAVGGFELRTLPDAAAGQFAAWHVPPECSRIEQALLLRPDSEAVGGCLRLVKFHDIAQRVMRSSQRSWDTGGIFDVDVYSRDLDRVYRRLQSYGWTGLGEPVDYTEADFHVRQVVAVGPDGLMLAIIQRYSPPVDGLPPFEAMSAVFNSTQMVRDFEQSSRFYREILGWNRALEFRIEKAVEPGADVLGLPLPQARTALRRIGMFHPQGAAHGSVELIENRSMRGRDFAADCIAPNVGLLALRFIVADAARYAGEIVARGGVLYSPPSEFELAPYGRVPTFSIRSPEGAMLEFIQVA